MKIDYQNPQIPMKYFSGFSSPKSMKLDNKIGQFDNKFLYYPFLKIERKLAIFDNKFMKNQ